MCSCRREAVVRHEDKVRFTHGYKEHLHYLCAAITKQRYTHIYISMSIFSKLFGKNDGSVSAKSAEDFMSLTRVYFQSALAVNLGITNVRFIPDVANFKRLFKVPTVGGKLGQGEKAAARKMLMQDYGLSENYFKEIDNSIKKHCRSQAQVQPYMFMFQGFTNDLMMMIGNLMQWKLRMPAVFKNAIRSSVESTVHEICTKTIWKKDDEQKTAAGIQAYKERLSFSEAWMAELVYNIVMLAKTEKKKPEGNVDGKTAK